MKHALKMKTAVFILIATIELSKKRKLPTLLPINTSETESKQIEPLEV